MARATMVDLIARARLLIGDNAGTLLTDDEIEGALDARRKEYRYVRLEFAADPSPVGAMTKVFYADREHWEKDAALYDAGYELIDPGDYSADYLIGRWEFTSPKTPPVFIVGKSYDMYGSAADLVETLIALQRAQYDFSSGDQSFKRSQQIVHLSTLAAQYRALAWTASAVNVRGGDALIS